MGKRRGNTVVVSLKEAEMPLGHSSNSHIPLMFLSSSGGKILLTQGGRRAIERLGVVCCSQGSAQAANTANQRLRAVRPVFCSALLCLCPRRNRRLGSLRIKRRETT